MSSVEIRACPVCGAAPTSIGAKTSEFTAREFRLAQCPSCHYSFVVNPRTDFETLYDAAYYRGDGAAHHTDYEAALADPRSVHRYEWQAVVKILRSLVDLSPTTRWLDYGCGLGGLVRYGRDQGFDVVGFDEGYAATRLAADGVPMLRRDELAQQRGAFDVVTAIEVLEHALDPVAELREIADLLAPSGVLFVTTGNAEPFRTRLLTWQYVQPDVHVGYFEPATLERALSTAGLAPEHAGYVPGFTELIRAKVLRTLGVGRRNVAERLVPWSLVSRVANRRYGVSAHPLGRKPGPSSPP